MRAAIYARRSTEEHQAESLNVQVAEARRFAAERQWTVDDAHVYIDDGVSRAEFKHRPGLIRLLNAAKDGVFDVLIVRDETRLGGDVHRTGLVIQDITEAGVRIFHHFTGEEVRAESATDKIIIAVRGMAAELEREKVAGRTLEHLAIKARRGLNVGGRVYGYDNVPVMDGERRKEVAYAINEKQAEIVRLIFGMYAQGNGYKIIAKHLNARGVPSPRAGKRGTGTWSPPAIGSILQHERYRGMLVWGVRSKAYRGGTRVRTKRANADVVRVESPELRIVSEELWVAARERATKMKKMTGRRGPAGPTPRYLLSSHSKCGVCNASIQVANQKQGKENIKVYVCGFHRQRGHAACSNNYRRPVEAVDDAVVAWIEDNVLREEIVVGVMAEIRRRIVARATTGTSELAEVEGNEKKLRAELARLVTALASGAESTTITEAIHERETRLAAFQARKQFLSTAPSAFNLEARRLEKEARARLADMRAVLRRNPDEARKVVGSLLDGPLVFTPVDVNGARRFEIRGQMAVGELFRTESVPSGVEHVGDTAKWPCFAGFPGRLRRLQTAPRPRRPTANCRSTRPPALRGGRRVSGSRSRTGPGLTRKRSALGSGAPHPATAPLGAQKHARIGRNTAETTCWVTGLPSAIICRSWATALPCTLAF